MKFSKLLRFVSFTALLLPLSVQAQFIKGYGAKLGINSNATNITLADPVTVQNLEIAGERRIGFNAAVFVEWLKSHSFSLLTEVEYSQYRFVESRPNYNANEAILIAETRPKSRLDYISLPVLVKLQSSMARTSPFVILGPRLDLLINREAGRFLYGYKSTGPTAATFLIEGTSGYAELFAKKAVGGTVGVGLETGKILAAPISLEVRYNFDFSDNIKEHHIQAKKNSVDVWLGINL